MKVKPLLSIVIPIFNTADYLEKCIQSIINQTYKNLEIICIDDGSTDGSGQIIDRYAREDDRIICIHQENQGESKARNAGLRIAKGDYITLVDSDDWLELDMYESLINAAVENNADMSIGGWIKELPDKTEMVNNILPVESSVFGRDELLNYIYKRDMYRCFAYMWDKIYKREIIYSEYAPIRLNENLSLGGDVLFLAEAALKTKRAVYVDKAFYHYRQLEESMCHTEKVERWRDWIKSYEIAIQLFKEEGIDDTIIAYLKRFLVYHGCEAAEVAIRKKNPEQLKIFIGYMKKYKKEYLKLNADFPDRIDRYNRILMCEDKPI